MVAELKEPKRRRVRDERPGEWKVLELIRLRREDPAAYAKEVAETPVKQILVDAYERSVKG